MHFSPFEFKKGNCEKLLGINDDRKSNVES